MLKNNLRVAFRNLTKQKFYAGLNIFGLTVGLTATLLIGLYISHELSYDKFHTNSDRLVKADLVYWQNNKTEEIIKVTPDILLNTFINEFPEITSGVRVFDPSSFRPTVVQKEGMAFEQSGFIYADSTFFELFTFPLITGSEKTVLDKPGQVVLSESAAQKYYSELDPMGKELVIDGRNYIITGLMADPPNNSSLQPSMIASFSSHPGSRKNIWGNANYYTYFLLDERADLNVLQSKIQPYLYRQGLSKPEEGSYLNFQLVPIEDLRLYSPANSQSDIKYVIIFSAIALLILVIAGINYMNLATARSTSRAKEVGVRKAIGALKYQLISQFLVESITLTLLASGLALCVAYLLLPAFSTLTAKQFTVHDLFNPVTLSFLLGLGLGIGILAGLYPAFVLSWFKPSDVLKGEFKSSSKGSWLRQGLVILQFSISVFLLISTLIVGEQLKLMREISLGYDRENVMVIPIGRSIIDRLEVFKNQIIQSTPATNLTVASETPVNVEGGYGLWAEGMTEGEYGNVTAAAVDNDYLSTLNIELIGGRDFSENDRTLADSGIYAFIVNESVLKELGFEVQEAIGVKVELNGRSGVINGVVKDFHFKPLHQKIAPLVLFTEQSWAYNYAMVRVANVSPESIKQIKDEWIQLAPEVPFSYSFLDDSYNNLYQNEARLGSLFGIFSSIGIIIACLGLLGLVSFTTIQRSKEIGIRKVLGASVSSIALMMIKSFASPVLIAFLIAAPTAYWMMNNWLLNFEYRVEIDMLTILISFLIAVLIAVASISYQVLRAATADPIKVLKEE